MTSTNVVRSGWATIAGSFFNAATVRGKVTAINFEMNEEMRRVNATVPDNFIAYQKK